MSRVLPIMSRLPPNLHALLASTLAADNPSGLMAALSSSSNGGTATPAQLFSQPLQLFTGLAGRLPLVGQTMKAAVDQLAKGLADLPGQEDTRKVWQLHTCSTCVFCVFHMPALPLLQRIMHRRTKIMPVLCTSNDTNMTRLLLLERMCHAHSSLCCCRPCWSCCQRCSAWCPACPQTP
jgi:hypothetical protein